MSSPTRISETFANLKANSHMAFMPFITAGDPDTDMTVALIRELSSRGVDLIEVGFPYSDPIADGPVIQASYTRALGKNIQVSEIFSAIGTLDSATTSPLVAMVSFAIIFRYGTERFLEQAASSGFSGLIVPDLPGDEAGEFSSQVQSLGLDLVQLIAPTTPPERAEKILQAASGFVYCISIAGTTGVRDELPEELSGQLTWLHSKTDLPLAVGFGISKPEQVETLRGFADGVIVGSKIVRYLESLADNSTDRETVLKEVGEFAESMVAATHAS